VETIAAVNSKGRSKANGFHAPEPEELYAPDSLTKFEAV